MGKGEPKEVKKLIEKATGKTYDKHKADQHRKDTMKKMGRDENGRKL